MAKIVPSDQAPSETVHYSLPSVDFDLGGSGKGSKKSYETEDRTVLADAAQHPWLDVIYDEADATVYESADTQVKPQDDAQSIYGPLAQVPFDPEEIRKVEEAKRNGDAVVAIDAGLDQDDTVTTGPVAETVAAAADIDTKDKD